MMQLAQPARSLVALYEEACRKPAHVSGERVFRVQDLRDQEAATERLMNRLAAL